MSPNKNLRKVKIVEMGPRDGLQNESKILDNHVRFEFIKKLAESGLKNIEIGAFVSPDKIPQMANSQELVDHIITEQKVGGFKSVQFSALVPNEHGMQAALKTKIKEVAVFAACTETFSQKNINCSIEESFERFKPVMQIAKLNNIKVRGYLSTCFYCPYEGKTKPAQVMAQLKRMKKLGVYEISIGDTIGAATPNEVEIIIKGAKKIFSVNKIAMHFHDTRGTAIANVLRSLELGIRIFDSSLGGLGGCPYAPGAQGNVATEDLVFMLEGMGFSTGINLESLRAANTWMSVKMEKQLNSKFSKAGYP